VVFPSLEEFEKKRGDDLSQQAAISLIAVAALGSLQKTRCR
jgi:hypothetical protein